MEQANDVTGVIAGQDPSRRSGETLMWMRAIRSKRSSDVERALLDWIPGSGITSGGFGAETQHQQNDRLFRTTLLFRQLEVISELTHNRILK